MIEYVSRAQLQVAATLARFVEAQALPGLPVTPAAFWAGLDALIHDLTPENRALLARRATLQQAIDGWSRDRRGQPHDAGAYRAFLEDLGYLAPEPASVTVQTAGVDPEIAAIAGPQLVAPIMNPRFALNAANARWRSLYDALYMTDALGAAPQGRGFDPARAALARDWVKAFLDEVAPLQGAAHADVTGYAVQAGALVARTAHGAVALADPARFSGYRGAPDAPSAVLLNRHGLHLERVIDCARPVGAADDADDKTAAYGVWLALMKGELAVDVGRGETRAMAPDRVFIAPDGAPAILSGRALMLVRTVGHLMTTPAIRDRDGAEAPEAIVDAAIVSLIAMHDLAARRNSPAGSVYIVKPKMHGPEEVAFADRLFARVEDMLGLPRATLKMGVMDEERRTTLNLRACLAAAAARVVFINSGFPDRTGDEIHTSMEAGPMIRKADMKAAPWIAAYEDWNVDVGLACGLRGRGQIGKGMWAMPDAMAAMLRDKIGHPRAGASCLGAGAAGCGAARHALLSRRRRCAAGADRRRRPLRASRDDPLRMSLADRPNWSDAEIRDEIENNVQGILGYVVRWVDQGVGCSKVPDIHDVGLMEDRATCRISSQHLANWLRHGVVSVAEVETALRRMAGKVEAQNAGDPAYRPMAPGFDGPAFLAARDLALLRREQPSGYTEPLLHRWRQSRKALAA